MLLITTIALANRKAIKRTDAVISYSSDYNRSATLSVVPDQPHATLDTYSFDPKLRASYVGFEVATEQEQGLSVEDGLTVAILDEQQAQWIFDGAQWVESDLFCSPSAVRAGISQWQGAIAFRIKLSRLDDGSTPNLSTISFGYEITGSNLLIYAVRFAVPDTLSRYFSQHPLYLEEYLETTQSQQNNQLINLLRGVNPERVSNLVSKVIQGQDMQRCVYEYFPRFILIGSNETYQIDETPTVLLEFDDQDNVRLIETDDCIRISDTEALCARRYRTYNQTVQVTVVGQTITHVEQICHWLVSAFDSSGSIYLPAFGLSIGAIASEVQTSKPSDRLELAQLPTATFTLHLINLLQEAKRDQVPLIIKLDPPQMTPLTRQAR